MFRKVVLSQLDSWNLVVGVLFLVLSTLRPVSLYAEDNKSEIADLKERIQKLEKLTEILIQQNQQQQEIIQRLEKGNKEPPANQNTEQRSSSGDSKDSKSNKGKKKTSESKEKKQEGTVVGEDTTFSAKWSNGLRLATKDKAFKVHVGGRLHEDVLWWMAEDDVQFGPGGVGPLEDGTRFRRARIRVNGFMWDTIEWKMEYGFENDQHGFFDVYGAVPSVPYVGRLQIGHFREPFSMDALTSGNFLTFMERSLIHEAFVPFRNVGAMITDTACEKSATWALGVFFDDTDSRASQSEDGKYSVTGRVTWNPWYQFDGAYALHLGLAGSYRATSDITMEGTDVPPGIGAFRFATRPEIRVGAPNFADTGFVISLGEESLLGLEAGLGYGPLHLQAEYVAAFVNDALVSTAPLQLGAVFFQGYYLEASYFLTGESRPYNRNKGVFGRVIPHENFFFVEGDGRPRHVFMGSGAWEVAARFSYVDLDNRGINGGTLHDLTLGLNWYLNPTARIMSNYILIWRDTEANTSDGLTQALAARFQIDF